MWRQCVCIRLYFSCFHVYPMKLNVTICAWCFNIQSGWFEIKNLEVEKREKEKENFFQWKVWLTFTYCLKNHCHNRKAHCAPKVSLVSSNYRVLQCKNLSQVLDLSNSISLVTYYTLNNTLVTFSFTVFINTILPFYLLRQKLHKPNQTADESTLLFGVLINLNYH